MPQACWQKGSRCLREATYGSQWQQWKEERSQRLHSASCDFQSTGGWVCLFSLQTSTRGKTVRKETDAHWHDHAAIQVPPAALCVCVGQEKQEGPTALLRSGPGSGGVGALCDPLLYLFLRNYPGFALKRARTSWTNVWLFGVAFPCSPG